MANVAVIGGGIIGASIAWRLSQSAVDVTLFDRGQLGAEASAAGAGMLAPGGELDAPDEFAALLMDSAGMYPAWVARLQNDTGLGIDYRPCGALEVAKSDEEWPALFERAARQQRIGIPVETHADGLFYPNDALVDSSDVMRALRIACANSGVGLREHSTIRQVELRDKHVRVEGEGFGAAVIAAGAWSSQIGVADADLPACFPVKGHLLGFQLQPNSVPHILRRGHTYILQRSNGFTIAGASTEHVGFDKGVNPGIAGDIRKRAELLLPMLEGLEPSVWTGLRPGAEKPSIGRYRNTQLWLAYGHYRNGILAAPATAERVASEIIANLGMG